MLLPASPLLSRWMAVVLAVVAGPPEMDAHPVTEMTPGLLASRETVGSSPAEVVTVRVPLESVHVTAANAGAASPMIEYRTIVVIPTPMAMARRRTPVGFPETLPPMSLSFHPALEGRPPTDGPSVGLVPFEPRPSLLWPSWAPRGIV